MAEATATKRKRAGKPPEHNGASASSPPVEGIPRQISFFQRVAAIDPADWGTRARVTVYRLEPMIDRLRSSEKKYITIYNDSPPDEERLKQDHGSGKYRLYLGIKTAGPGQQEREVDSIELDILDPKFPPNLDLGDWIDDPKNRKWAWAKRMLEDKASKVAAQQPAQPPTQGDVLTQLDTLDRIQDRAVERLKAASPPVVPPPPATDPIDMAVKIIALTKGGGDTALIEMFRDEMKALRDQNIQLQTEARTRANTPAPDPLAQIDQLGNSIEKLKKIGIIPEEKEEGVISKAIRSRMPAWMELLDHSLPELLKTLQPISTALAAKMMQAPRPTQTAIQAPAQTQPANGQAQPTNPEPPPEAQEMVRFMAEITPRMIKHVYEDAPGDVFAQWIADGYSAERVNQIRAVPPENIVLFYKASPAWEHLKDRETQLLKFWQEFHEWKPEEEEGPSDGMEGDEKGKVG